MSLIPFRLEPSSRILLTGAGGGFDVYCTLPLALELAQHHEVFLGSYSFTPLNQVENGIWHKERLLEITAESTLKEGDYFPERWLAKWYQEKKGKAQSIYCFGRGGVVPTLESYQYLIEKHQIDTVFCVDGGIDGLFRGDECDLGTPSMDSISVVSTALSSVKQKYYTMTAFGIEGAEGKVSHGQALRRVAELTQQGAFLGVGALLKETSSGKEFLEAVDYTYQNLPPLRRSIILSSLVASVQGKFGRTSVHAKTEMTPPWISPLTSLYWFFDAEKVAKMKLFYTEILDSHEVIEVSNAIDRVREKHGFQDFESIPI